MSNFFTFSRFTLFVALLISVVAAWYSVQGLTTIFAGAVIPIIIMGSILELAKITTTVWLHRHWDRASIPIRTYLTSAVIALAFLTSMGIFGLLSKAHSDQGAVSGDVQAKVSILDEKIKTQRENIDLARKALEQMDAQVEQRLARGTSENSAERAVQIRRQQAGERARLQKEISSAQQEISKLNEERAPIASQLRKVEAEVGPIKYIAALIYGDNPDAALLERAVRWVTILLVVVFDPLAIILILAANSSLKWERQRQGDTFVSTEPEQKIDPIEEKVDLPKIEEPKEPAAEVPKESVKEEKPIPKKNYSNSNYLSTKYRFKPFDLAKLAEKKKEPIKKKSKKEQPKAESKENPLVQPEPSYNESLVNNPLIETENVTTEAFIPENQYIMFEGKQTSLSALRGLRPDLVEKFTKPEILFGVRFPSVARTNDIYTRTDIVPNKTYKFVKSKWVELDKMVNTDYLQNIAYIQYLISKLDSGEYNPTLLTTHEEEEIKRFLQGISKLS